MYKFILTTCIIVTACVMGASLYGFSDQDDARYAGYMACDCADGVEYDHSLPRSHPANQCALAEVQEETTWVNWALGGSRSTTFHFLDLLELLSKDKEHSVNENQAKSTRSSR